MNLVFSSKVSKRSRAALEDLLFFNPRQFRVREEIVNSLTRFGHPRIEEQGDQLVVRVGDVEAQTLFAYNRSSRRKDPIGLVVFVRTCPTDIVIIHVAVHEDYSLQGRNGGLGLGVALIDKVKEIASRIVGVERIVFFYRKEVAIRVSR